MNEQSNGATNGHGAYSSNGHTNGNGHTKIFDLSPKADPLLSQIVPAARRKVCTMTRICEAARMFYCYLTDMSLLPGVNSRKGVVKFSDFDLSLRFKVSDKTIRNWKRALESTGEIWLTEKFMKNTFPQTVYNITAIVGQATLPMNSESADGSTPEDEVFSSNRRRQMAVKRDPGTGKFSPRVATPPTLPPKMTPPTPPMPEVSPENLQNQAENEPSGKILPPPTAIDCRPPRQMVAALGGNSLPSPTAIDCRGGRQSIAVVGGNGLPSSAANGFRGRRQSIAGNGKTKVRELVPKEGNGGEPTPRNELEADAFKDGDTGFGDWCDSWKAEFRGKLVKELGRCKVKLQIAPSAFWQRRADFLQAKLDGGKPPIKALAGPVRSVKPAAPAGLRKMSLDEAAMRLAAAKAEAGL
jgi:hypothetical protein